jgi:hypothetical protein
MLVEGSTVILRALSGLPLADPLVRDVVVATAHAIAERTGVKMIDLQWSPDAIMVTLGTSKLAAIGFAAELRRLTNRWHAARNPKVNPPPSLWGDPPPLDEVDSADWWKKK